MEERSRIFQTREKSDIRLTRPKYGLNQRSQPLRVLNQKSDRELKKIQKDYFRSLNAASVIFNDYIFRKQYVRNGRKNPLNKPLYETWMFNLSNLTKKELQRVFSWHFNINPGAWRGYIDWDNNEKKIWIGYVGRHLRTKKI